MSSPAVVIPAGARAVVGTSAALLAALVVATAPQAAADSPSAPVGGSYGAPAQAGPPSATVTLTDTVTTGGDRPAQPAKGSGPADSADSGGKYEYRTVQLQGPCPATPTEPNPKLLSYERRLLPDGPWQAYGGGCTGNPAARAAVPAAAPVLVLADLRRTALTVRATVRPARPQLAVQPAGGALVNQASIFYLADPGQPPTAGATNPLSGRQVTVTLSTPSYDWDFGDTTGRSQLTGRGQPYSPGATIPAEGQGDPWVSHTYRQPASLTVQATATYQVTYTYTGNTDGPLPLEPLVLTDTTPVIVHAARSELVSR